MGARRRRGAAAVDPWAVLRDLRAHPFIEATTTEDPINGCDAVDALAELRTWLDDALARAPTPRPAPRQRRAR